MRWIGTDHIGTCPSCEVGPRILDADSNRLVCQNPACSTNQSSAPSPRSDVGENDLGGGVVPASERWEFDRDYLEWDESTDNLTPRSEALLCLHAIRDHFIDSNLDGKPDVVCPECMDRFDYIKDYIFPPEPPTPAEVESPEPPSAERGTLADQALNELFAFHVSPDEVLRGDECPSAKKWLGTNPERGTPAVPERTAELKDAVVEAARAVNSKLNDVVERKDLGDYVGAAAEEVLLMDRDVEFRAAVDALEEHLKEVGNV